MRNIKLLDEILDNEKQDASPPERTVVTLYVAIFELFKLNIVQRSEGI
ncbi:MAG: hypothetical protein US59_C0019G0006 [Candidatus Levybacteria bacterium GW2011_GWB1_37_8]|nr:MAG: hypothetical protein US59_C0019G0006 [Candidatus Levybacteria bacterium GW2011_GWB1_37_8]